MDWNNLQAAHYCCNQAKSNHVEGDIVVKRMDKAVVPDGEW